MDEGKRYSDEEVQKILKRALEIQRQKSEEVAHRGGSALSGDFTLEEIESMAAEIGIEQSLVQSAALAVDLDHGASFSKRFLGGGTAVEVEGRLDIGIDEKALREVEAMLRNVTGCYGAGTVYGSVLSWANSGLEALRRGFSTEITVRTGTSGTTVHVRERLGNMAGGIYGGLVGGIGLGAGLGVGFGVGLTVLGSGLAAAGFAIGILAGSYGLARMIFGIIKRHRRRETKNMLSSILAFIRSR